MYMTPGSAFTGRGGTIYSAAGQVDSGDVALAIKNGWSPGDPGPVNSIALTLSSGSTNNLSPIGFTSALKRLEITCNSGGSTLTGLMAGVDDQEVVITNVGSSGTLTLAHQSTSSVAGARFAANADTTVSTGSGVIVHYSAAISRWIVVQ